MAAEERTLAPGSWLASDVKKQVLEGRKLEQDWDVNTAELEDAHKKINGDFVRTRFPPEPNGYLHIGHAKSMNMNFSLAFEKLGVPPERRQTVFRFDDTNPEAESTEYIDNIREDVDWMGWAPFRTTFASDYFPQLHALAVQLIKSGNCYVCFQKSDAIEKCREVAVKQAQARQKGLKPGDADWPEGNPHSPHRDTTVEENLKLFEDMRKGKFAEGEACLRMKMDMSSTNMNMFDQVAYRIKFVPHPHAGREWCIYPTYDFTHCVQDSLEHVDFSICTLEFETRRESYYWLLNALNIFKPMVYEMSRLNIEYIVLSKRKLIKLVNIGFVHGWDDPRMPTIKGLRRRGYTSRALNRFCSDIGVTRNENLIEYSRLEDCVRNELDNVARRVMAVIDPIKVTFTNFDGEKVLSAPDFPQKPDSANHNITFTETIFIDAADFRVEDSSDYFGLAPNKWVGLKYANNCFHCEDFKLRADGSVEEVIGTLAELPPDGKRPKGILQWVPSNGITFEARLYESLFTVPEVTKDWEAELNHNSEIIKPHAMIDPSILDRDGQLPAKETHFQCERVGIFVVDMHDSTKDHLVMNRTVSLKANKKIVQKSAEELERDAKRKADREAAEAAKKLVEGIPPEEIFKRGPDASKYSAWDKDGIPTHDAKGEPIAKSAQKKLKKDQGKHKKVYEKAQAAKK